MPYNDNGNNVVRVTGTEINWNASINRSSYSLSSGSSLQVRFKASRTDPAAHFYIEASGSPYANFGGVFDSGKVQVRCTTDGVTYLYL